MWSAAQISKDIRGVKRFVLFSWKDKEREGDNTQNNKTRPINVNKDNWKQMQSLALIYGLPGNCRQTRTLQSVKIGT